MGRIDMARRVQVITLALLAIAGLIFLVFSVVFVVALIKTIQEMRRPAVGFNAGLGFGGDLGVTLIKGDPAKQ
jgi:hypothetical protein